MAVHVKICGLSTTPTLHAAISAGASHIGLVHFAKSPRHISLDQAAALRADTPARVGSVLLLVNPEGALLDEAIARVRPDIVQLHGDEQPQQIAAWKSRHPGVEWWKAVAVKTAADIADAAQYAGSVSRILYDAKPPKGAALPGGNGVRFDWGVLENVRHPLPWILSGGLDVNNVAEALRVTHAEFIDVSSGVESAPGIKENSKIAAFIRNSQEA